MQDFEGSGNAVGINGVADFADATAGEGAIVGLAQSAGLVDGGREFGIEAGRHAAAEGLFLADHDFGVFFEDGTGFPLEQGECSAQDVVLEVGIVGLAQRSTERELAVQDSRRAHSLADCANRGDRHGGQAGGLEDVGQRTHGTRAERSNRSEEYNVNAVGLELGGAGRT